MNERIQYTSPQFRHLSDQQLTELYYAALQILENTGAGFDKCPEALEILSDIGADTADPQRVKIPHFLVEKALKTAPKKITLYTREGEPAIVLDGTTGSHFGGSVGGPDYLDISTSQRRPCYVEDLDDMARLVDGLSNIEWLMTCSTHPTVPPAIADIICLLHVVLNTSKPVAVVSNSAANLREMLRAGVIIAGDEQALKEKPFIIGSSEPITPLYQEKDAMENSLLCAEKGIPNIVYGMPMAGASTPCTSAAVLSIACAEVLSQLVVLQAKNPGTPVIFGSIPNIMDMKTCIFPYGAPELSFLTAALTELSHYYELPMFGTAGCTDSDSIDAQSAAEVTYQVLMTVLSGADLVHDVGVMDSGRLFSPQLHVFVDEVIEMAGVSMKSIEIDEESLPLELINRIGPRGNYLSEEHTLKHFHSFWSPDIFDRSIRKEESKRCINRLNNKTKTILEKHHPKLLPADISGELLKLEKSWFKQVGAEYPYPARQ
jgi:trimethylamine--corrinoid protein Co-methyltransferase